jgi:hypothetical protein
VGSRSDWAKLTRSEVAPEKFRGKRVRIYAMMKSDDVTGGAGVFASALRFDRRQQQTGPLKRRETKPDLRVHGTSAWVQYSATLEVPTDVDLLDYGVRFEGTGTLWVDDVALEVLP